MARIGLTGVVSVSVGVRHTSTFAADDDTACWCAVNIRNTHPIVFVALHNKSSFVVSCGLLIGKVST